MAAFVGVVGGDWGGAAFALSRHAVGVHTALNQQLAQGVGARLAQLQVVVFGANIVGMSCDFDANFGILAHKIDQISNFFVRLWPN